MSEPVTVATVVIEIFSLLAAKLASKPIEKGLVAFAERFRSPALKWGTEDYSKAAQIYLEELAYLHGHIRVIGLDEPLPFEGMYTDVNILSGLTSNYHLTESFAEQIYLGQANIKDIPERDRQKDGLNELRRHDKLFLLGKPGAGKTTFLKHALHEAIAGKLYPKNRAVIPVFINLNVWSESNKSLIDFIIEQFKICNFPSAQPFIESILTEGKAIILCDGLDEIKRELRSKRITELNNFCNQFHRCPFVISCRVAAIDYTFEKFTYVEMADFNSDQVQTFVKHWFTVKMDPANSIKFFEELDRPCNKGLKELAKTPLLLGMLCLAFPEELKFPTKKNQIYANAIGALLNKVWAKRGIQHEEIYRNLDLNRKKQMFSQIAFDSLSRGKYIFTQEYLQNELVSYLRKIPPEDLSITIDGEAILRAIESQHGLLIECAKGYYSFSHLSIQEYFAAEHIVQDTVGGALQELVRDHFFFDRWREVILRTAESMASADRFFELSLETLDVIINDNLRIRKLIDRINSFLKDDETQNSLPKRAYILHANIYLARLYAKDQDLVDRQVSRSKKLKKIYYACYLAGNISLLLDNKLNHNSALDRSLTLNDDFRLDSHLIRSLVYARGSKSFDFFVRKNICKELDKALKISSALGYNDLTNELSSIRRPNYNAYYTEWTTYAQCLSEILLRHRPVDHYEFSLDDTIILIDYIYSLQLLLECLDVAYVKKDRIQIKNRLLCISNNK